MAEDESELEILQKASLGDQALLENLMEEHRPRLRRMVRLRLDHRVKGRVDSSDVIQEAYLEAFRRLPEYLRDPTVPFFVWLRFLTGQKLVQIHRQHLGVRARDVAREVSLYRGALPEATSAALVARLAGQLTSPSLGAAKAEMKMLLQDALNTMDPLDREVLVLRHFEQLTYAEVASELDITESGAAKRYVRALQKLRRVLSSLPGAPKDME